MRGSLRHVVVTLCGLALSTAAFADEGKRPFGPWDAGPKREVKRQGRDGLPRAAHPMVGDAAKVPASGPPAPPLRRDEDVPETALVAPNRTGSSLSANPLYLASLFYSNFLTKVDGPRCQHLPTCSRFASQAVARHGAVGFLMGLERLIQDDWSSSIRRLPEVEHRGTVRHFDPLENYEFWKPERMTGFPPPAEEQPLELAPLELEPPGERQAEKNARAEPPGRR